MQLITVVLPLRQGTTIGYTTFDKEQFEQQNHVKLSGKILSATIQEEKLILVYKGKRQKRNQ